MNRGDLSIFIRLGAALGIWVLLPGSALGEVGLELPPADVRQLAPDTVGLVEIDGAGGIYLDGIEVEGVKQLDRRLRKLLADTDSDEQRHVAFQCHATVPRAVFEPVLKAIAEAGGIIVVGVPDLANAEVEVAADETDQAAADDRAGKLGLGGGAKGDLPGELGAYKIRFIRLEHGGAGWDDGMGESGADINFLRGFSEATGFRQIAEKGESHRISLLKKYPDDAFPPFVYLTGDGDMGRVSSADKKILREYCLKGGMLIADAGSKRFHASFSHFIRGVFPDKPLLDIADDDMIYQIPYKFPGGAPAFWGHGGRRALGVKHDGRWVVFYHPGDMNDAWKSEGHSDVKPELREAAMNLGVNLVYYAFKQWDEAVTKAKK